MSKAILDVLGFVFSGISFILISSLFQVLYYFGPEFLKMRVPKEFFFAVLCVISLGIYLGFTCFYLAGK